MPAAPDIFAPLPTIEAALACAIAHADATPRLREAIEYATLGAGKRIRPLLAWYCCEALGGKGVDALPACVAVEFVHCFSLVHDDLPALDNDALRRGKPTVHVTFGEALAILTGDAMLNMATQALLGEPSDSSNASQTLSAELRLHLVRVLTTGTQAMVAGQVADTMHDFNAGTTDPHDRLHYIHRNKTGALLEAACVMGALCGSVGGGCNDPTALNAVRNYATVLGLLFQAVDDLLDVTQSAEHTGKHTNKDAQAGKLTFPTVHGVDRTRALIRQYMADAAASLEVLTPRHSTLLAIAEYVATRTR